MKNDKMVENKNCNYCKYCKYCKYCESCYSCESCESCIGLRFSEKMIFCIGEGKYERQGIGYQKNNMVFNKPVDNFDEVEKQYNDIGISLKITENINYEEAWKLWWKDNSHKAEQIKALPNFDSEIFEKITGIKIDESITILEKDGKRYEVKIIRELL